MASMRRAPAPRTSLHAVAVMLEALDKKFDAFAEGQRASEQRIIRTVDERFAEVNRRFEVLEAVVRQNSEAIRKNSEAIERLQADMQRFDRTIQGKINQDALDSLERRVSALEARLGIPTS